MSKREKNEQTDAERQFNSGIRASWLANRQGFQFTERQEQPAAQATQADEDALVQRAGYGSVVRSSELDELGPDRAGSAMNRILRGEGDPSRQTVISTSTQYAQANQAIRGMLARRNASRITLRGGFPGDVQRGAIESTRDYEKRKREHRRKYGMSDGE